MDNICHTLTGLALGEAGLKRKTALGNATLMVAANIPDVDALTYLLAGPLQALGFRRGLTHGIPALAVWPFVVAALMLAIGWLERRFQPSAATPNPRGLLLLGAVGVVTHPLLDWMNTYGMRWLSPLSDRWYYGDALFIADPWLWIALLLGVVGSARRSRLGDPHAARPARVALAFTGGYIAVMLVMGWISAAAVRREIARDGDAPSRVMAAPVPVNPVRRNFVAEVGRWYETGTVVWRPLPVVRRGERFPRRDTSPVALVAAASPEGRVFLRWSRFPLFRPAPDPMCPGAGTVCVFDMRYWPQRWASVAVTVERPVSLRPQAQE